jgi:hypothetical protein
MMGGSMEIGHINEQIQALKNLSASTQSSHLDHEGGLPLSDHDSDDDDGCLFDGVANEDYTILNDAELINILQEELFQKKHCLHTPSKAAKKGYGTLPRNKTTVAASQMKHSSSSTDLMMVNADLMTEEDQVSFKRFQDRRSSSMENLMDADNFPPLATRRGRSTAATSSSERTQQKPQDCLKALLAQKGIAYNTVKAASLAEKGFFVPMKQDHYADYTNEVAFAARQGDLDTLKAHVRSGKSPLCCNRHNESIMHTICRKGHFELLEYALGEGGASVRICCDQQRNPLHDAAWTHQPNFQMIEMILSQCPDLLYIEDNRGHTPLDYVGVQQWDEWCSFLKKNQHSLVPHSL